MASQNRQKKGPMHHLGTGVLYVLGSCAFALILPVIGLMKLSSERKRWAEKRENIRRRRAFKEKCCFKPQEQPKNDAATTRGTGPLFAILPAEIRRRILIEAFGDRTVHLDLSFRKGRGISSKAWRWNNCVCHSDKPGQCHSSRWAQRKTPCGYHGAEYEKYQRDPMRCPGADEATAPHAGSCPKNCGVGASGWLLTCRQA